MTATEFSTIIKQSTNPLKGSIPTIKTFKLSVKKHYDGLTILDFYTQAMPSISREVWKEKIISQNLKVEGKPVNIKTIVKSGEITQHTTQQIIEPNVNTAVELVEWNNDFIVLNKPAPLPIHPGGRFEKNTLISILKDAFPKEDLKLVHRIDGNTTGLVIIARNKTTANQLVNQFKNQTLHKEYLALVEGIINKQNFELKENIGTDLMTSGSRKVSKNGKTARTACKVLKTYPNKNQTLLSVIPHSGRTNQIRIHLANIGYPIVGDVGYKEPDYFKNNPLIYSQDCLFLHAWKLTLTHQNKHQIFEADVPRKFSNLF